MFDWKRLAAEGIGRWPAAEDAASPAALPEAAARAALTAIRYDPGADIVTAFQRHWRPSRVDSTLDAEALSLIRALAG